MSLAFDLPETGRTDLNKIEKVVKGIKKSDGR